MTNISERVRALRKALNLTQEQLGARVGMSRVDVNHVENGRRHLTTHEVRLRFAQGLGTPVAILDSYLAGDLALDHVVALASRAADPAPRVA